MPRSKKSAKEPRFEDALGRLEAIVSSLEEGDLSLEESLQLFEEGVRLTRLCSSRLDDAQRRIELLTRNAQGELKTTGFDTPAGTAPRSPAGCPWGPRAERRRCFRDRESPGHSVHAGRPLWEAPPRALGGVCRGRDRGLGASGSNEGSALADGAVASRAAALSGLPSLRSSELARSSESFRMS